MFLYQFINLSIYEFINSKENGIRKTFFITKPTKNVNEKRERNEMRMYNNNNNNNNNNNKHYEKGIKYVIYILYIYMNRFDFDYLIVNVIVLVVLV